MDTILIDAAYILAGDSKFRLSGRKDKGQSVALSFTSNQDSDLAFLHLDGDFSYSRTGYYPESNSFELYLGATSAAKLCGMLKNVVAHTNNPGESPELPEWKHGSDASGPEIIEEYSIQARSITMAHPVNLSFKPRTLAGFTTYVALTRPYERLEGMGDLVFRLKFWLTERSVPELELLQRAFRQDYGKRTQLVHVTITFSGSELSLLQRQLEVLGDCYMGEMAKRQ